MIKDFFSDIKMPQTQALLVLTTITSIMLIAFGLEKAISDFMAPKFYWLTATSMMVIYVVASSLGSLVSDNYNIYFRNGMYSFAVLSIVAGFLAYFFSGLSIFEAGSYSWLYKVVFIVYIIFMTMVRMMKVIVEFAQREEWNAPKQKKRK